MDEVTGDGWNDSAQAWLEELGEGGDLGRPFVLDGPMTARLAGRVFRTARDGRCAAAR